MKVAVLGDGAWGTALAMVLAQNSHRVVMWGRSPERLRQMMTVGSNEVYLPGVKLPSGIEVEDSLERALGSSEAAIVAIPSSAILELAPALARFRGLIVSTTKGIEASTGLTMTGVLKRASPGSEVAALTGPSIAREVAEGVPTAIVAAAGSLETARAVQGLFHRPTFRVYAHDDLPGAELGGALKNIFAIAAGVCDGLGFGDNAKAALITRSLAEMRRIGVVLGGRNETFGGLSGLGDLTVTCFSPQSRNRTFGENLARGIAPGIQLVEGVRAAPAAHQLAITNSLSCPIIEEVHSMVHLGKDPRRALHDLLARDSKAEDH